MELPLRLKLRRSLGNGVETIARKATQRLLVAIGPKSMACRSFAATGKRWQSLIDTLQAGGRGFETLTAHRRNTESHAALPRVERQVAATNPSCRYATASAAAITAAAGVLGSDRPSQYVAAGDVAANVSAGRGATIFSVRLTVAPPRRQVVWRGAATSRRRA